MQERTCPTCGSSFKPARANQRYCPPTAEDRARINGQARSRCATRGANHAYRSRKGVATKPLTAPVLACFDCAQCGKACEPGRDGVAAHATKFCGYDCKARWHKTHEDGWERTAGREQREERAHEAAVVRLLTAPPLVSSSDAASYLHAVQADPCAYCGRPGDVRDHIVPKADGGLHDWTNRTAACHDCNGRKQNVPLLIFMGWKLTRDEFEPWRRLVADLCTRT